MATPSHSAPETPRAPSRRSRLWQRWTRLWRRVPAAQASGPQSPLSTAHLLTQVPAASGEVPLPAHAPERLSAFASRYFNYGEELFLRGSPELAAAFYRQAYALLRSAGCEGPYGAEEPAAAADPDRAQTGGSRNAESEPLRARLNGLRDRLNRDSVDAVSAELRALREQGLRDPELHKLEGLAALLRNDANTAEQRFQEALALAPDHYACLVNLAGLMLRDGRTEPASKLLQRALAQVSNDSIEAVPALTNLALAHQQAGRAMDAALLLHQVHRIKPGHLRAELLLEAAQTLEQMGDDLMAIELLDWQSTHEPTEPGLRKLAALLERRGDYQNAALVYRKLLRDPQDAAAPAAPT